jgi:hypothetical protein
MVLVDLQYTVFPRCAEKPYTIKRKAVAPEPVNALPMAKMLTP